MLSSTALSHTTPTMSPSANTAVSIEGAAAAADPPPTSSCPAAAAASLSPPASPTAEGQDQASWSKTKAIPRAKPRSTIDPLMFASLATPFAVERPSAKKLQSPCQPQQKHQRQHSAEQQQQHTTYSSASSSSPSSPTSFPKELQHHFSFFGRRHLRQHSHPQISSSLSPSSVTLSPGPTATTLAQSPHRHQNTTTQTLAHPQLSSPFSAVSGITRSPSPSTSTSPRYHVDNSSNTTAATLPPLPFFAPLPFSPDQKHYHHQQYYQDEPQPLLIPTTVASEPQQQHNQDPFFDSVNATTSISINSANINANRHLQHNHIGLQTSNNDTLPPSSPPLLAMLTAHSGGSGGANVASLNAIPIPTRASARNNSSNSNNNHNNNGSHSSNIARSIFGSSIGRNHHRRSSNSQVTSTNRAQLLTLDSTEEGSSAKSESSYLSSRRSSKDSSELTPGKSIDELVNQLTMPDHANSHDHIARTKVFLLIYRKFMRPRELLEMLIARFDALGDSVDDEDVEAKNTRLRICSCLYYWLKNHPNDTLHRQTRQRVAAFLRERVAFFPYLNDIHIKLLPLSSIHYLNTWRWPHQELPGTGNGDHAGSSSSRNSSIIFGGIHVSSPPSVWSVSDDDESDAGFPDSGSSVHSEEEMDEDREWGMVDEDEIQQQVSGSSYYNSDNNSNNSSGRNSINGDGNNSSGSSNDPFLSKKSSGNLDFAAFGYLASGIASRPQSKVTMFLPFSNHGSNDHHRQSLIVPPSGPPLGTGRDRRSSTGSFVQVTSPCAMETFVAGRRGSASSVSSNPGPFTTMTSSLAPLLQQSGSGSGIGFPEGDNPAAHLHYQLHQPHHPSQPMGHMPYIGKRGSSQAYRQQRSNTLQSYSIPTTPTTPLTPLTPATTPTNNVSITTATMGEAEAAAPTMHSAPVQFIGTGASGLMNSAPALSSTPTLMFGSHLAPTMSLTSPEPVRPKAMLTFRDKEKEKDGNSADEKLDPMMMQSAKGVGSSSSNLWMPLYSSPMDHPTVQSTPLMDVKNREIAEQLTCLEYGLFMRLKPRDMLRQVWKTKKGSAAFQACITHFNYISSWVGTMILLPSKTKHRAKMMEKFISVAKILREMGNFNTLMAILAAMNTSSIHRLNQTREHLQGKDIWNTLKDLEHLMSSERSFFEYRAALRGAMMPCIPYLGVHLADLFSISEGNRDYRQNNIHRKSLDVDGKPLLHWQKFVLMTDIISMVAGFQKESCYRIKSDPVVSRLIMDVYVLDEEELYTKSIGVEPGKLNHSRSISKFSFF